MPGLEQARPDNVEESVTLLLHHQLIREEQDHKSHLRRSRLQGVSDKSGICFLLRNVRGPH